MSSQVIKQPLVTGVETGRGLGSFKHFWSRLLAGKKKLLLGGGFMAAVVLAGFYFWADDSSTPQYLTARVERGNLRNTVTATGTLQAVTTVQVGSQASGTISALYADFNSVVKKGQVVAQLDPAVAKPKWSRHARTSNKHAPVWLSLAPQSSTLARVSLMRRQKISQPSRRFKTIRQAFPALKLTSLF
jgi:multidrug efflux pump subunit AcrA (membrane-fusion protein)